MDTYTRVWIEAPPTSCGTVGRESDRIEYGRDQGLAPKISSGELEIRLLVHSEVSVELTRFDFVSPR